MNDLAPPLLTQAAAHGAVAADTDPAADTEPAADTDRAADRRGVLQRTGDLCSAALMVLGVVVLLGWFFRSEVLVSVLPGRVTMKANTALGFLGCGVALSLAGVRSVRADRWCRVLSCLVLVLGALTVAEYALHVNLRIDELLYLDRFQRVGGGRMAYVTAVAFCLSGASLFLLAGGRVERAVSQGLALLLGTVAFGSMVGYLYGVPVLYGSFRNVNTMALHTGVGFLVLGCGLVVRDPESAICRLLSAQETGSWLIRRILPLLIVLPVLLGYLYLRPAVNLGELRFGMALFAVTLVLVGALGLLLAGLSLNRAERQRKEIARMARQAAEAIELSERELRLVTDHLPTLISYVDASGRFLRVNRTYEAWLGQTSASIVGRTVRELLGEAYWERTQAVREAAARGVTTSVETVYPTVRGDRRTLVTYAPDLDERGGLRGFACMVIDVEDQRRAEAALRENEKLAAVGRLSSSIAHEINNPLDAAINLVYLVREQTEDAQNRELLDIAEEELKRVATIAGHTLRFHKQADRPELVLAADLFTSVLVLHSGRLRSKRIQVERRDRAGVPVACFEGEIRQVLNNLVANAIDATEPGGRLVLRSRAAYEWSSGRSGVALTIADDGCGMEEETRARIFEAFFTTKGISGTGLGLWISAEILARHGGRMRLRSCARGSAHGSVFTIFLPLDAASGDGVSG